MKKKSQALCALSVATVLLLSACGSNGNNNSGNTGGDASPAPSPAASTSPSPEPSKAPEAKDVTLRVFSTFAGTDAAKPAFQKALDDFSAKFPNIKITNDAMSANDDSFRTKVNTDMSSGNEPDLLFYFVGADAKGFVDADKVVPLNALLDEDAEWKAGFNPAALDAVKQPDGNIYAAPLTGYYEGLYVNKDIFKKYNLELPTDWDKFTTAIKTLNENKVIPLAAPFDQSHYLIEHFVLGAAGGAGHNSGILDAVNPDWELGLSKLNEIGKLGAFPKDAATIDLNMAAKYYSQGKAAMVIEGSWAQGSFSDEVKAASTVLPFPAIPGGKGDGKSIIGGFGSGFYLSKSTYDNADKKDAAVQLLKFLTSPDTIKAIAQANSGTPAAANVQVEGLPQLALDGFKMASEAPTINAPIDTQVAPETFTTIRQHIQGIVSGKDTAKAALEAAQKIEVANKK